MHMTLRILPHWLTRAALLGLAITVPAAVVTSYSATPAAAQSRPDAEVDLDTFYRELSPYGDWLEHRRWGEVWRPNVSNDWRPYTRGHWAWTDEHGWYWVAEEEWGWAPFHYGRWVFDDDEEEWLWIPGYEWAPAWVQWRESEDAVGWAPLPPDSVLDSGALRFSATAYDSPRYSRYWVFAPPALIFLPGLYRHIYPTSRHSTVWRSTRHVHFNHRLDRGRIFMPGIDHRRIERWSGRSVPVVTLRAVDSPRGYGWRNMQDRTSVPVYRPRVVARPDVVRPQRPLYNPRGDRDRDGIPNWRDRRPNQPDPIIVRPGSGPRGDRDGDGRPNFRDPRPNTPDPTIVRPGGGPRGDRDGDGRPNFRDPRPNTPDARPIVTQPTPPPRGGPPPGIDNTPRPGGRGGLTPPPPPPPVQQPPPQRPAQQPPSSGGAGGRSQPAAPPPPVARPVAPPPVAQPPAGAGGGGRGGPPPGAGGGERKRDGQGQGGSGERRRDGQGAGG